MTAGDDQGAAEAPPTDEAGSGSNESGLGVAATVVDTRPSADVRALESARTAAVTPFESARTALQASAEPLETARTALLTPSEAPTPGAATLKPFGPYSRIETLGQQGN